MYDERFPHSLPWDAAPIFIVCPGDDMAGGGWRLTLGAMQSIDRI